MQQGRWSYGHYLSLQAQHLTRHQVLLTWCPDMKNFAIPECCPCKALVVKQQLCPIEEVYIFDLPNMPDCTPKTKNQWKAGWPLYSVG
jgi:hypothetical protein